MFILGKNWLLQQSVSEGSVIKSRNEWRMEGNEVRNGENRFKQKL